MTDAAAAVSSQSRRNRLVLLALLASFIIPFTVGDLAYRWGWYAGGKTNKGRLLQPPLAVAALAARAADGRALDVAYTRGHWWLLYIVPPACEQACRNRLYQMRQIPRALGRDGARLQPLLLETAPASAATEALLAQEFAGFRRVQAGAAQVDAALRAAAPQAHEAGLLYVMDPMGWIMLSYPPEADEKTSLIRAEDVLDDLRKLLKNSRIG